MKLTEQIKAAPIQAQKTLRTDQIRALTSAPAGKIIPLAVSPLLREDRVNRGQMRIRLEMMETAETLMNAVNVTVRAHFVPFLAFERFDGSMDRLNRSYQGIPDNEGAPVIPFFDTATRGSGPAPVLDTLGIHVPTGATYNTAFVEAYNTLVNYLRRARSTKLPKRAIHDATLATAFWKNTGMSHIVPDFDQAMIDGEVELNIAGKLPVTGIGLRRGESPDAIDDVSPNREFTEWNGGNVEYPHSTTLGASAHHWGIETLANGVPRLFAELDKAGVKLSLANIEMAKQTAAFAQMRKAYSGLEDDYIIDLLMDAVRVPDASMSQPILLDRKSTIFGYSKRHATDGSNLAKSVTTGETFVDMRFRTPAMNTGGIIIVTAEIVPEQMFERQKDTFLFTTDVDQLPAFTRDYLDPEKVAIVSNDYVDVYHNDPNGTFGYAPLNHEWKRNIPRIGGKFMRKAGDPFSEDRQRIWSVETENPSLTEDFYLANGLHHKVFADTEADPFEITTLGRIDIIGNTVFGKGLQEDTDDYSELTDEVDTGRIEQA